MPSDPEKNMEPLLKAFAEKRRQAAGAEPVQPAAARARLHEEVRQRWPNDAAGTKPAPVTATLSSSLSPTSATSVSSNGWLGWRLAIQSFWPRLATAGFILVLLGATVWMFSPALRDRSLTAAKSLESDIKTAEP